MLKSQKTISFYGQSVIEETGKETVVLATMDATISNNGIININKYTSSKDAYAENASVIEEDWDTFEKEVHQYAETEIVPVTIVNENTK